MRIEVKPQTQGTLNINVNKVISSYYIPNSSAEPAYYSIGDCDRINDIIDADDENMIPLGSLLDPTNAWLAVNDVFDNPKKNFIPTMDKCKRDRLERF